MTPSLNRTGFDRDNNLKRKGGGEAFSGSSARGTAVPVTTLKLGGGVGVLGQTGRGGGCSGPNGEGGRGASPPPPGLRFVEDPQHTCGRYTLMLHSFEPLLALENRVAILLYLGVS